MNEIIINDDLLLIDNFLDEDELHMVKFGIYSEKLSISPNKKIEHTHTHYNRLYLERKYKNNTNASLLLTMIPAKLNSINTNNIISKLESFPFQSYFHRIYHYIETQLTVYTEGGLYNWHIDNDHGRQLTYILPIQMTKEQMWSGGELCIIYKGECITIKPKNNQLIIFSGHLKHKVNPVKMKDPKDLLSGRVVINGHIGFGLNFT